jgi:diacylglycerol O-acyltransferase / wax synthase
MADARLLQKRYIDTCCLGINVDTAAIPDYDVFHDVLVDGFDEVLALAR